MKVCKKCGSPDVAKSVWFHLNAVGIQEMGEQTFYWCFNCEADTTVADKELLEVKEPEVVVEKTVVAVSAHLKERPIVHKTPTYSKDEIERKGAYIRSWHLVKNAKKKEAKGFKVEWDQQDGEYVPVWITLSNHKVKYKNKKTK